MGSRQDNRNPVYSNQAGQCQHRPPPPPVPAEAPPVESMSLAEYGEEAELLPGGTARPVFFYLHHSQD